MVYKSQYNPIKKVTHKCYEHVVFLEGYEAEYVFEILDNEGYDTTLGYLTKMHNVGTHDGSSEPSFGTDDETYVVGKYIMSWNRKLGYIGLDYEL